jgi:four helix bundle protein
MAGLQEMKGKEGGDGQRQGKTLARNVLQLLAMDRAAEDLKDRTKRFAISILDFVESLPHTPTAQGLGRQLIRSGTGVAGNYRSSCRARSHTEFTARMGIVLEEADESELWLDIANERGLGNASLRGALLDESRQLRAIFSKACLTARARERARR